VRTDLETAVRLELRLSQEQLTEELKRVPASFQQDSPLSKQAAGQLDPPRSAERSAHLVW